MYTRLNEWNKNDFLFDAYLGAGIPKHSNATLIWRVDRETLTAVKHEEVMAELLVHHENRTFVAQFFPLWLFFSIFYFLYCRRMTMTSISAERKIGGRKVMVHL